MIRKQNNRTITNPFILIKDYQKKDTILNINDIVSVSKCDDGDSKIVMRNGESYYSNKKVKDFFVIIENYYKGINGNKEDTK